MTEVIRDDLAAALDGFWLTIAGEGRRVHGQIANPDEVAGVLHATLSRIAAERSPDAADAPLIASQCDRRRQMVDEHTNAVSAVSAALKMAAPLDVKERKVIAAGWAGLKVLSGEEAGGACACGQENCRG